MFTALKEYKGNKKNKYLKLFFPLTLCWGKSFDKQWLFLNYLLHLLNAFVLIFFYYDACIMYYVWRDKNKTKKLSFLNYFNCWLINPLWIRHASLVSKCHLNLVSVTKRWRNKKNKFCSFLSRIPLSFILGFYVSQVC